MQGGREERRKGGKKGEMKQMSEMNNKRAFSFT